MISMYRAGARHFIGVLRGLSAILAKTQQYADVMRSDPERLASFLFQLDASPVAHQVQVACDTVEEALNQLAHVSLPKPDTETRTLADLRSRIARTVEFVQSVKPEQLEDHGDKPITLTCYGRSMTLEGSDYLLSYVIPRLHLHAAAAYHTLHHYGIELDPDDYLFIVAAAR